MGLSDWAIDLVERPICLLSVKSGEIGSPNRGFIASPASPASVASPAFRDTAGGTHRQGSMHRRVGFASQFPDRTASTAVAFVSIAVLFLLAGDRGRKPPIDTVRPDRVLDD